MIFMQKWRRRRLEGTIAHIRRQLTVIDEMQVHTSNRSLTERYASLSNRLGELEERLGAMPA